LEIVENKRNLFTEKEVCYAKNERIWITCLNTDEFYGGCIGEDVNSMSRNKGIDG